MIKISPYPAVENEKYQLIKEFSRKIRASEYHITNACNIRCKGCWFFEHEFDVATKENKSKNDLDHFVAKEVRRGVNAPLLIGGEPTLFPKRVAGRIQK